MNAARSTSRSVLVDEPERLVRDALVAAIDATPGLSAINGSITDAFAAGRADAAVVAA
jgi:DNA-binding CsgD family transcriptional regulator